MLSLARWASSGPFAAGMTAFALLVVGLIVQPLLWLSSAILVFVALAQELREVLRVLAIALGSTVVFFAVLYGAPGVGGQLGLSAWLPPLGLALFSKRGFRLADISAIAALASLILLMMANASVDGGLFRAIESALPLWLEQMQWQGPELSEADIRAVALILPGAVAAMLTLVWLFAFWIGRSWFLRIYQDSTFGAEFAKSKFSPTTAAVLAAIAVGFWFLGGDSIWRFASMVPVMALASIGFSRLHRMTDNVSGKFGIRVLAYLVTFIFWQWLGVVWAALAVADSINQSVQKT